MRDIGAYARYRADLAGLVIPVSTQPHTDLHHKATSILEPEVPAGGMKTAEPSAWVSGRFFRAAGPM